MAVFVTGATGFVGRHFLSHLLEVCPETSIVCLAREASKIWLADEPRVTWVFGALEQPETYRAALKNTEYVFHLAARVGLRNGAEFYADNTEATRSLLQAVPDAAPLKRFVYLSSVAAIDRPWDAPCDKPLDETFPACPQTDYGRSKRQAEELIQVSGLPHAILRPAFIYGTHPRPGSSMDPAMRDVRAGEPYTRFPFPGRASGIYAPDFAEVIWTVSQHPAALNEDFFVANPQPVGVSQFMAEVARAFGVDFQPSPVSSEVAKRFWQLRKRLHPHDLVRRILFEDYFSVNSRKLSDLTGFQPRTSFEEGIARTVAWYLNNG